eukprot:2736923-Pleurochrysis_carterae.AAC.2
MSAREQPVLNGGVVSSREGHAVPRWHAAMHTRALALTTSCEAAGPRGFCVPVLSVSSDARFAPSFAGDGR